MDARENKRFVEEYFRKVSSGDPSVPDAFSDDVVWWVPPGSDMAGSYRGKNEVLGMFARGVGLYSNQHPMKIQVEKLVAEGDTVCAQVVIEAVTAKGRPYRNHYHFAFQLDGGKIRSVKEYVDTQYAHDVLFG
jgi:ketosteroid isomerase-like protein